MKDFMKKHDIMTKAFSLLAAFVLWIYVMDTENPPKEITYPVTVNLTGEEDLLNLYNLSVIEGENQPVKVTLRGNNDEMIRLTAANIVATADLSSITTPGTFSIAYNVTPPSNNISVEDRNPAYIDVVVDKIITQSIPVYFDVIGEPAEGYHYEEPVLSETRIRIEGPQTEVSQITYAYLRIDANSLNDDFLSNLEYDLMDAEDNIIQSANIKREQATVNVFMDVKQVVELPLVVEFVDGETIDSSMVKLPVTITPATIKVIGEIEDLANITEINLGQIELTEELDETLFEKPIILPDGVSLLDDNIETAQVEVDINLIKEETVIIDNINLIDTALEPSEKQINLVGKTISVTLKATENVLEQYDLTKDDFITATIEYNSNSLPLGMIDLAVTITAPEDLEVVGEYSISAEVIE